MFDANEVQHRHPLSDKPKYPELGLDSDALTPAQENSPSIRDTWEQKCVFFIKDKYMNCVLCQVFPPLLSLEVHQIFREELMTNPNVKFKDLCGPCWKTYGKVI